MSVGIDHNQSYCKWVVDFRLLRLFILWVIYALLQASRSNSRICLWQIVLMLLKVPMFYWISLLWDVNVSVVMFFSSFFVVNCVFKPCRSNLNDETYLVNVKWNVSQLHFTAWGSPSKPFISTKKFSFILFLHVTSHVVVRRKLLQNKRHFYSVYAANRCGNMWWIVGFPLFGMVIICCFIIDSSVIHLAFNTDAWEVRSGCANYWNFRFCYWKSFGFYLCWISFNDSRHSLRFVGRSRVCPGWWWVDYWTWDLRGGFIFWRLCISSGISRMRLFKSAQWTANTVSENDARFSWNA